MWPYVSLPCPSSTTHYTMARTYPYRYSMVATLSSAYTSLHLHLTLVLMVENFHPDDISFVDQSPCDHNLPRVLVIVIVVLTMGTPHNNSSLNLNHWVVHCLHYAMMVVSARPLPTLCIIPGSHGLGPPMVSHCCSVLLTSKFLDSFFLYQIVGTNLSSRLLFAADSPWKWPSWPSVYSSLWPPYAPH